MKYRIDCSTNKIYYRSSFRKCPQCDKHGKIDHFNLALLVFLAKSKKNTLLRYANKCTKGAEELKMRPMICQ